MKTEDVRRLISVDSERRGGHAFRQPMGSAVNDLQIAQLSGRLWNGAGRQEDLVARVSGALRAQILAGDLGSGARLPSESDLAKLLRISRPTLREAARILAREGLIDIRHGVGTFVADRSRHLTNALDTMRSLSASIRAAGGEPRVASLSVSQVEATRPVAAALGLEDGALVAQVSRVRLIDDRPLALASEYVVLRDEAEYATLQEFDGSSIYAFMTTALRRPLLHSEMSVTAVSANDTQARLLHLKRRAPLLMMCEVHYDQHGERVLYSVNHHNTAVVDFTLVRAGMRT